VKTVISLFRCVCFLWGEGGSFTSFLFRRPEAGILMERFHTEKDNISSCSVIIFFQLLTLVAPSVMLMHTTTTMFIWRGDMRRAVSGQGMVQQSVQCAHAHVTWSHYVGPYLVGCCFWKQEQVWRRLGVLSSHRDLSLLWLVHRSCFIDVTLFLLSIIMVSQKGLNNLHICAQMLI
jgi:hypothetical protein